MTTSYRGTIPGRNSRGKCTGQKVSSIVKKSKSTRPGANSYVLKGGASML